ncbi:MAG: CARDB domain-containing protein, partial [Myxococcota bacterium]
TGPRTPESPTGPSAGPVSCLADLDGGDELEIVIGGALYRLPVPPAGYTFQSDCTGGETDEAAAYCDGELVEIWSTGRDGYCAVADVFGANGTPAGPDNPLDGNPEIILVGDGAADNNGGRVTVIDPNRVGDKVVREYDYRGGTDGLPNLGNNGGPPNVDDFDGDGFPEMGVAFQQGYAVTDFQDPVGSACSRWTSRLNYNVDAPGTNTPREPGEVTGGCTMDSQCSDQTPGTACNEETGRCVCLHNSWIRQTEDQSSRSTGSSVFDFNGDGAAEVIYNDECQFRIYDGLDGTVLFEEFSESRTRVEYPVVADVDNDGNAEIVFGASNESGFCSFGEDSEYNAGLEVWGDAGDFWVSARRMWNQHAYHVTNITENASVPRYEPKGWLSSETNGRDYNSYRSNPRTFGVAPDLRVAAVQVASGSGCGGGGGAGASIVSEIGNIGDLRVGPEVVVGYEGDFGGGYETLLNSGGDALVAVLENTLEPRDAVFLTTAYDASWNGESVLPARVRVSVDVSFDSAAGTVVFDNGRERECVDSDALESNNALEFEVASTEPAADLVVRSVQANSCGADGFSPTVNVIVDNVGVETAPGALVRLYAGDPNQGGTAIGEAVFPEDIAADGSVTVSIAPEDFPFCVSVQLFAAVDPENAITECNDGNNLRAQEGRLFCCVGQGG